MPALAAAGYHAIAPDQRGYGRTTGWDADTTATFGLPIHEPGTRCDRRACSRWAIARPSPWSAMISAARSRPMPRLIRPDIFKRMVLMSAPFGGPPSVPFDTAGKPARPKAMISMRRSPPCLGRAKHYQWYYSTRPPTENMWKAKQGVHDFLRAYYHHKSADWKANKPFELQGWTAEEVAQMPTYYNHGNMPTAWPRRSPKEMPSAARGRRQHLADRAHELRVYSEEYARNGFQGGLNGIAVAHHRQGERRAVRCSAAAQSTCPRPSSRAAATGASTRCRAPSTACRRWPARR